MKKVLAIVALVAAMFVAGKSYRFFEPAFGLAHFLYICRCFY